VKAKSKDNITFSKCVQICSIGLKGYDLNILTLLFSTNVLSVSFLVCYLRQVEIASIGSDTNRVYSFPLNGHNLYLRYSNQFYNTFLKQTIYQNLF